jgi:signal transduction histidine kinase
VALFTFGLAALWVRQPGERRDWLARLTVEGGRPARRRVLIGVAFVVGGVMLLLDSVEAAEQLGPVALAIAATTAGLFMVFGPWIWRLGSDLARERRDRIRTEERAEMAAHLHDSVLQTLSLIQRVDDPARMATLARAQERELRAWLFTEDAGAGKVRAAIREIADKVEAEHDIPVELVTVGGDPALDHRTRALVQACGEAITNAAKHAGIDRVSVYIEAGDRRLDVWVVDQGEGFHLDAVPADRRGIADSIMGRMRRAGGGAEVSTSPGEGTEVHVWTEARQ